MSNFQRTRSKVWWGDSPPNIGSPVAHASNWEARRQEVARDEDAWAPQLPHWAAQQAPIEESPQSPANDLWVHRENSPGSHKSQDSGFSDSDSSPPALQQNINEKRNQDSPDDKNLAECEDIKTPLKKDLSNAVVDYLKTPKTNASYYVNTPVRSLIKTPKDVQDYLQACCNTGHKAFQIANDQTIKKATMKTVEKTDAKKNLMQKFEICPANNIEVIQLSLTQQIAVNNQPRMRSPITRISYHTPVHFYRRSTKSENEEDSEYFKRNSMNRSFNYPKRSLDEQLLDDGPHSLSYVEEYRSENPAKKNVFTQRKITDSLNLKTPKKTVQRSKQKVTQLKSANKPQKQAIKVNKSFFNFLPKRNDTIKTIYDITKDSVDRVPTLGLPDTESDWVIVDSERDTDVQQNRRMSSSSPQRNMNSPGILIRKITPPLQFQDAVECNLKTNKETIADDIDFCETEFNACTSTPKAFGQPNKFNYRVKPVNLIESFNCASKNIAIFNDNITNCKNTLTSLERISENQSAPVKHWLCEQIGLYEPECMTTLQSKALGVELNEKISNSSMTITGNIRKVQTHGQIIFHQFNKIMLDLQERNYNYEKSEIKSVVASMCEFVLAHSITLKIKPPGETPERWEKIKVTLQNNIRKITEISEDIEIELNETQPEINVLQKHLKTTLNIFIETVRAVLVQQMKTLVSMLEDPPSDMILKSTLTSLGHLGVLSSSDVPVVPSNNNTESVSDLPFIECGVPRALLSVIIETNKSSVKALSLRALATVCINSEAVQQFEEAGGIDIISDILNDSSNPEPQIKEAITVLTQITAPWLQGDYRIKEIQNYFSVLIKNITDILSKTTCCQLLLLCAACLVNLTNIAKTKEIQELNENIDVNQNSNIIEIVSKYKVIEQLLEAVKKRGPDASIFLQEQTAMLINVMSTSSKGQTVLAACPATPVALVCFLRTPCASPIQSAHLQSEFRLITNATEALSRLCKLPVITTQIIQLEGVTRLVRVIQAQKMKKSDVKRSDQILINCLRSLRLIAKHYPNCFDDIDCDVSDMIKPTLLESVKLYSARQESYV